MNDRMMKTKSVIASVSEAISFILILGTVVTLSTEAYLLLQPGAGVLALQTDVGEEGDRIPVTGLAVPEKFLDTGAPCVAALRDYMIEEQIRFGAFINEHFQSSEPASNLIPTAIEKFRQVRADARKFLKENFAHDERGRCERTLNADLLVMKQLLRQHITENATAKKTTLLLERYKAINEKLRDLNFTIAQFYGYFATFAEALPCYATDCQKG